MLEPAGPEVDQASSATSKSAVSRRFVESTKARLAEFRSRPLGDRRWLVVYIDGFGLADEAMVGALGIDEDGNKVPLSLAHGTTEDKAVCRHLLDDLEERGFDPSAGVLFVIDGGKAIYHAIADKWGDVALVQRCRKHKAQNVLDLLPAPDHPWVRAELNRAWGTSDAGDAERALRNLAAKVERAHPDASASLREGLTDTVTVNRLGVTFGFLARTLATTNPIEPTIDIIKVHAGYNKPDRAHHRHNQGARSEREAPGNPVTCGCDEPLACLPLKPNTAESRATVNCPGWPRRSPQKSSNAINTKSPTQVNRHTLSHMINNEGHPENPR